MIRSILIYLILLSTVLLPSCRRHQPLDGTHYNLDDLSLDPTQVERRRLIVTDSSGVMLIHSGLDAPESRSIQLERVYHVGVVFGKPEYEVWAVDGLVIDTGGHRIVSSAKSGWIRVYDEAGRHVREFGARGKGPGDFFNVSGLFFAGDTLVLVDSELRRTTLYSNEGAVIRTWSNNRQDGSRYTPVGMTSRGWVIHAESPPPRGFREHEAFGRTLLSPQYDEPRRFASRTLREDRDSLFRFDPVNQQIGPFQFEITNHPRYKTHALEEGIAPPFAGRPSFAFDRNGYFYVTRPTTYRIDVYDDLGKHVRGISRDYVATPIDESITATLRSRLKQHLDTILPPERRGIIKKRVNSVRFEVPLPPLFPPLGQIHVSPGSYIWVNRRDAFPPDEYWIRRFDYTIDTEGHFPPLPASWDVFNPKGVFVAQVIFPPGFRLMAVECANAHGVEKDSLGVEYVVTYRVIDLGCH